MGPRRLPNVDGASTGDVSKTSIPELNNLFTAIGGTAFAEVLKTGGADKLTPERYSDIVRRVVAEKMQGPE